MNPFDQIRFAGLGLLELIAAKPTWRGRFVNTRGGLTVALVFYFAIVVVAIFMRGLVTTVPTYAEVFVGVMINALPVLGLFLAVLAAILIFQLKTPTFDLLVPGVHALAWLLLVGIPLSFLSSTFATATLGMLGYIMYRAGREIAGLGIGPAIVFAVLCVVVLVALPLTLYMLMAPGPGPI
jgi:hypothetical protein